MDRVYGHGGQSEIYVKPSDGFRRSASLEGRRHFERWRGDGKELLFMGAGPGFNGQMMPPNHREWIDIQPVSPHALQFRLCELVSPYELPCFRRFPRRPALPDSTAGREPGPNDLTRERSRWSIARAKQWNRGGARVLQQRGAFA